MNSPCDRCIKRRRVCTNSNPSRVSCDTCREGHKRCSLNASQRRPARPVLENSVEVAHHIADTPEQKLSPRQVLSHHHQSPDAADSPQVGQASLPKLTSDAFANIEDYAETSRAWADGESPVVPSGQPIILPSHLPFKENKEHKHFPKVGQSPQTLTPLAIPPSFATQNPTIGPNTPDSDELLSTPVEASPNPPFPEPVIRFRTPDFTQVQAELMIPFQEVARGLNIILLKQYEILRLLRFMSPNERQTLFQETSRTSKDILSKRTRAYRQDRLFENSP
ncbi:hypothetical protein O181_039264 [Austropuccinia psidii MF-1]|uniref:Zn(2)-C6 fungal-type domain-containing protein n=1 Tax=Austropuccinia psidii MF-1 TaxID=1389203 RepID=A0A9Q3DA00_9BASI|nr:hypothetical protein [Austropuccinia psidii MF-1]